jgi:ankyrin repeat protein
VAIARAWLESAEVSALPVRMICEVQMLLRETKHGRHKMHELYKVYRAADGTQLHSDFKKTKADDDRRAAFEEDGQTPLTRACRDGDEGNAQALLADAPEARDVGVAFVVACKYNRLALVETMLAHETLAAVAKSKAQEGLFALVDKKEGRADEAVVRVLLSTGAVDVNAPRWENINDSGVLYYAAMNGHANVVKVLVEAKADVNQTRADCGQTPLSTAAENGHADVVSRPLRIVSAFSILDRYKHLTYLDLLCLHLMHLDPHYTRWCF